MKMCGPESSGTALAEIARGLRGTAGKTRLESVADCLVRVLGLRFAFIAERLESRSACVLAFSGPDEHLMSPVYAVDGTPSAPVLEQGAAVFRAGVARRFPADVGLRRLGVESFSGRVLEDAAGSPIGLIAVMDAEPIAWTPEADTLLSLLALYAEPEVRRIRGEREISRVARQWTATVDTMPDFVAVIAPDYRLLQVNLALARFASCRPKDLVGHKCHEVLHRLDHPWPNCPHAQALRSDRSVAIEVNDPHIGVPLCVTCTPFHDDDGELVGTVHVARDISEQKQAARVSERQIGELRQMLATARNLSGFLTICAGCKRIRNDEGRWEQIEVYLLDRTDATFTHGICAECARELYPGHVTQGPAVEET